MMKRIARLKRKIFTAKKWIALIILGIAGYVITQADYQVDPRRRYQYDVVLSSYMRGGSTLMGMLLGFRSDTFYVYEPFWKSARWIYWNGTDTVCHSEMDRCRPIAEDVAVDDYFAYNKDNRPGTSLSKAKHLLEKIYDCDFNNLENWVIEENLTIKLGGPSWNAVRACLRTKDESISKACINWIGTKSCKEAKHRVTKVLRFTLDNMQTILQNQPNLKIIHLYRDPRAVINSRMHTKWYPIGNSTERIISNAKTLCAKMDHDFRAGHKLLKLFPTRFKFVYYEDMQSNSLTKLLAIYSFLGMSKNEVKYKDIAKMSLFHKSSQLTERERNSAFWWRKTLGWNITKSIERECETVLQRLGYKTFSSEHDMQDLKLPSVRIPYKFQILE